MSEENNIRNEILQEDKKEIDPSIIINNQENFASPIIGSGDDDLKIENLTYEEAYEYVSAWVCEQKRIEKLIAIQDIEIEKWGKRVILAEQKGMNDLALEAKNKLVELKEKRQDLSEELENIKTKTDILKDKLLRFPKELRSVNTDLLLMNIENLLGKSIDEIKITNTFDKIENQNMLEKLKAKMNEKK